MLRPILATLLLACRAAPDGVVGGPAAAAPMSPVGLRIGLSPSPLLGVAADEPPPRLSWQMPAATEAGQRGAPYAGYEVQAVDGGGAAVWSSGRRATERRHPETSVAWGGNGLRSEAEYAWRVRSFASASAAAPASPWSEWARFSTAPNQSTWRQTSWLNGSRGMLRRDFTLPTRSPVQSGYLYASTIGFQELYLNGELLGNQSRFLFEPGQSAYFFRALVTAINVTAQLRRGGADGLMMTLGAQLGNGPCSIIGGFPSAGSKGGPCHDYGDVTMLCCKRGKEEARAFRAILSVMLMDGSRFAVDTGSPQGWQTADGPIVQDDLYMGEIYDGRLERPGFFRPRYTGTAGLVPASVVETSLASFEGANANPNATMSTQLMPDIAVTESFRPIAITTPTAPSAQWRPWGDSANGAVTVFEYERYMSGRCTMSVTGGKVGTRITLIHSPVLETATGKVIMQFPKYDSGGNANMTDVFILGEGSGPHRYTPHFTYHGLRFVEVHGLPSGMKITADTLVCHMSHTNVPTAASFSSDNDVLDGVFRNLQSAATVLQTIPLDVPDRERLPWTGDAGDQAEGLLALFDATAFLENDVRNFLDAVFLLHRPQIGINCPNTVVAGGGGIGDPAWSSVLAQLTFYDYQKSGDKSIIERAHNGTVAYLRALQATRIAAGPLKGLVAAGEDGDYLNVACIAACYHCAPG